MHIINCFSLEFWASFIVLAFFLHVETENTLFIVASHVDSVDKESFNSGFFFGDLDMYSLPP